MTTTQERTSDGHVIVPGLRVFTINYRWGTVGRALPYTPGWFEVVEDEHGRTSMNGERMRATPMPRGPRDPRG